MPRSLPWFSVRLALVGSPLEAMQAVVADLQEELQMRPHLGNPRVVWDDRERHVRVEVDSEGLDAQQAADLVAEEILEVVAALLHEFDRVRVDVLHVQHRND